MAETFRAKRVHDVIQQIKLLQKENESQSNGDDVYSHRAGAYRICVGILEKQFFGSL